MQSARMERHEKAKRDRANPESYTPELQDYERKGPPPIESTIWNVLSHLMTFPISDSCIPREGQGAKKAWREKIAIFEVFLLFTTAFVVGICSLPLLLCTESKEFFDTDQIVERGWTVVFGKVYDLQEYAPRHPGGSKSLESYFGKDASGIFPRLPPTELPAICLDMHTLDESVFNETNSLHLQNVTCPKVSTEDSLRYGMHPCHTSVVGLDSRQTMLGKYEMGDLVISASDIGRGGLLPTTTTATNPLLEENGNDGFQYILIDDYIYDVSDYVNQLR